MDNKIAVYGIYPTNGDAEAGLQELRGAGFRSSDISVLFASPDTTKAFAHENSTKAPEGATSGVVTGATIGGVLGWLAGMGSIAIPGVGPFIAAGPIMATLAGIAVGGTVGGLAGALIGLGIPEYEAKRYENHLNKGGVLISVHADNDEWAEHARALLKQTGAQDIGTKAEVLGNKADYTNKYAAHP